VATTRHVSCGGYDLEDVRWDGSALSGVSRLVADDEYVIVVREPAGYRFLDAAAEGAVVASGTRPDGLREVRLRASASGRVAWRLRYAGG
jgi:hypothetical protein